MANSFVVYLSASRDKSQKNKLLAEKLLKFADKAHGLKCIDISREED